MIARRSLPVLLAALLVQVAVSGERTSFNLGHFNGLAINGYDPMSYWLDGKPVRGDERFRFDYGGATWQFVSQERLEAFAESPERYAPQYGGYCAYAAAQGALADVDPHAWRIWNDRLYLNYSPQVRRIWASDIDANILRANANWTAIDPDISE